MSKKAGSSIHAKKYLGIWMRVNVCHLNVKKEDNECKPVVGNKLGSILTYFDREALS